MGKNKARLTDCERACMRKKGERTFIDGNLYNFDVHDARLFVTNLDPTVKNQHLWRAFKHYKSIKRTRVIVNPKKKSTSKRFGFVSLGSVAECEHALVHMNGKILHGKPLIVKRSTWWENMDPDFKRHSALASTLNFKIYAPKKK